MSTFKYKDYTIHYIIDNEALIHDDPIIMLNGIMMSSASWEMFKDSFSENHCLIRYDMIDQGLTTKVDFDYTQELQVDLLRHLMIHLKIEKANLVGISYGASVALQFSIKYQHRVSKLILANGVAKTSLWLKAIGDGWNQVGRTRDGEMYYNITIPYIYSPTFYIKQIEWMEDRKKILVPLFSNPEFLNAMERLTKSAETHDTTEHLNQLKVNTLIISSELDFLTPPFEQLYLHQNIQNSELYNIPNCGHASMYEVPELFTKLVLDYIQKENKNEEI